MATLPDLDTSVYSKLSNDSALITALGGTAIYNLQAPASTALPYIVFYQAVGVIPNIVPRDTFDHTYRIESRGSTRQQAGSVHLATYTALHQQTLTVTSWTNYWTRCEQEQRFIENVDGAQYWRFVWDVRVLASKD